jgi:Holliday junction resolvase RusA-like endonuclease
MVGTIVLHHVPVPKPRMTRSDAWAGRDCVVRYFSFKDELVLEARRVGFVLGNGFRVIFYMPMPKSWSKKKQEAYYGKPHDQTPDIDNLLKAVMDSLLKQDNKVHHVEAFKVWSCVPKIIITNDLGE